MVDKQSYARGYFFLFFLKGGTWTWEGGGDIKALFTINPFRLFNLTVTICLSCLIGIPKVVNSSKFYKLRGIHEGLKSLYFLWLFRVEYNRAHELCLSIHWADWNREADSLCFTLSLTSSHSTLKCLTQSSGSLQETDLRHGERGVGG